MRLGLAAILIAGSTLHFIASTDTVRAEALSGKRYVNASALNARLCPKPDCPVAAKLAHGTAVTLYERNGDWVRVSEYADAAKAREKHPDLESDKVARWVAERYLADKKPAPLTTGSIRDKRIFNMPRPGQGGLTAKDVQILRTYAKQLLESGACSSITNADKSNTRPGTYFVTCGNEYQSRFFKPGQRP